ncbi:porin family protein [Nordella sp. HKS 07]|uniref:outer membrane protein n=1 Tax=Nordella sp. HKS 07 TaxID=2712222 RepID=UPI0013E16F04|nr:outer membrane beta-barrel protein [Nordella sp. HKS 07]QIG51627.1 porin family protein [Nordella sp. HKS 07]
MIKKLSVALALAVSFGTAGYASAADIVEPACRDFSGFYIGAHAGWLWANIDAKSNDFPTNLNENLNGDGFVGGGLVGANFQSDCIVFGVEGDLGWVDANGSHFINDLGEAGDRLNVDTGMNGHIRARLGWSAGDFMPFIAGGASYLELDHDTNFGNGTESQWGWNIGAGIDWAVSDSLILRAEYIYDDFSSANFNVTDDTDTRRDFDIDANSSTVRAAIIWNFGGLSEF